MDLYQVAEIELSYKRQGNINDRPKVTKSADAYTVLINHWEENKLDFIEQAKVLLLNRAGFVIGISNVSTGGISGTYIDQRIVFVTALKANASSIIIAHNHPSGNLSPSEPDKQITKRFTENAKLLDITVLDHIIVTREGYYSFADEIAYSTDEKPKISGLYNVVPF